MQAFFFGFPAEERAPFDRLRSNQDSRRLPEGVSILAKPECESIVKAVARESLTLHRRGEESS